MNVLAIKNLILAKKNKTFQRKGLNLGADNRDFLLGFFDGTEIWPVSKGFFANSCQQQWGKNKK